MLEVGTIFSMLGLVLLVTCLAWQSLRRTGLLRAQETKLATRWGAVERMLEFSQTVLANTERDAILQSLVATLGNEFSLESARVSVRSVGVLTDDAEARQFGWPTVSAGSSQGGGHNVCRVPFRIGPTLNVTVQLTLPDEQPWTADARRLAHGYVNGARSALRAVERLTRLEAESLTDPLTGLYNRRALDPMLKRELALAERYGQAMSVVMIDVDHFKMINDALGHAAGDALLRALAGLIRQTLRKSDLAFRVGGDEFVLVLPHTNVFAAQQAVNHLRGAIACMELPKAVPILGRHSTLSIGVAERTPGAAPMSVAELLACADKALYEAKGADRNCVRVSQAA